MATVLPTTVVAAGAIISSKHFGGGEHHYLLVKETRKDIDNLWSIPGGHLEPGETLVETAIRELREESGYDVELTDLAGIANATSNGLTAIVFLFYGKRVKDSCHFAPTSSEIKEVAWFTYEQILELAEKNLLREATPALAALERAHRRDTNADDFRGNDDDTDSGKLIPIDDILRLYPINTVF